MDLVRRLGYLLKGQVSHLYKRDPIVSMKDKEEVED